MFLHGTLDNRAPMEFDFNRIQAPFRMRPGLVRLPQDAHHLTPLDPASALYAEKRMVSDAGAAVHCVPGFDATDALACLHQQAGRTGARGPERSETRLELLVEEDLAVLDSSSGCVPWMCVCVPSGWAPEDKLGHSLAAIHAPVADNAELAAAWPHLARLLTQGGHWERHVWTISPSGRHDQHPHRHPHPGWPQEASTADPATYCFLRTERQTFMPVHDRRGQLTGQAVFTIRVSLAPLAQAVSDRERATRLHDAISSMSDAVLRYKNLLPVRNHLLAWLESRAH